MNKLPLFLLVDDSEEDVLLIQRAFEKSHLTNPLQVVGSGDAAIEYLSGHGEFADRERFPLPAVILLDLRMPGRDGYDVLEWTRAQPALRNIRIIVLTAFHSVYDVDMAYKMGANSFLVKPVEFESLVDLMRSLKGFWVWHAELPQPDANTDVSPPLSV